MLAQIYPLPGAKHEAPRVYRDSEGVAIEAAFDVGWHIFTALQCVREVWLILWHQSIGILQKVVPYAWICVFVDGEASTCVHQKKMRQTGMKLLDLWQVRYDLICYEEKSPWACFEGDEFLCYFHISLIP